MQRIFLSFLNKFDLPNQNPNDASVWSVLRFGWKNAFFVVKKYVFSMFQSFYTFSFSMRTDNNFLITISGDSATYLL